MILLETVIENDFSAGLGVLLASIGTYIVFLRFTLHPTKNRIENIQKSIIEEIKKHNEKLFSQARSIIRKKTPQDQEKKRERYFIKRRLNSCTANYHASDWIRSISGISIICLEFCVFLLFAVIVYRIKPFNVIIDQILLSSQLILIAIPLLVWLVHKTHFNTKNEYAYSFMFMSSWYGLTAIGLGMIMAYLHWGFSIIPEEIAKILIYISFGIPLIPILIAFFSTTCVFLKRRKSCNLLKKALEDKQSGELAKKLKLTNP